jgi:hypothetical protein
MKKDKRNYEEKDKNTEGELDVDKYIPFLSEDHGERGNIEYLTQGNHQFENKKLEMEVSSHSYSNYMQRPSTIISTNLSNINSTSDLTHKPPQTIESPSHLKGFPCYNNFMNPNLQGKQPLHMNSQN